MSTVQGDHRLDEAAPSDAEQPVQQPPKQRAAPRDDGAASKQRTTPRGDGAGGKRRTKAATQVVEEAPPSDGAGSTSEVSVAAKPRLQEIIQAEVVPTMMQEFGYSNVMQVPRLQKVVLNIGLGEALTNPRAIESATKDLTAISGQKPIVTRARSSIAGFKLRQGNPIGLSVTLRGARMYHFMDRLINAALPRVRDFRGVSSASFDGRGNYSMGIREQIIFSEIDYGEIERIRGFQVTIATTAKTDAEAARLLAILGMPFERPSSS